MNTRFYSGSAYTGLCPLQKFLYLFILLITVIIREIQESNGGVQPREEDEER